MTRKRTLRLIAGLFVPHTVVVLAQRLMPRLRPRRAPERLGPAAGHRSGVAPPFSYEDAVSFLTSRGLDEHSVRLGSIQEGSMAFAAEVIARHLPRGPVRALQVGNFVGISLAALSDILVGDDPRSLVVSIDPNVKHLGVDDPQSHVLALLSHFGLQDNNLVISGYSLDGPGGDDAACENTLASMERLGQRFDLALVDGNHEPGYVRGEVELLVRLLNEGGLLILDDVSHSHKGIRELFKEAAGGATWPLEKVGSDERLGILRKTTAG